MTLNYLTQDGTASSASDYVAAAGTVTFAVGQQFATVSIVVNGDVVPEANETLNLLLTGDKLRNGPETLVGTITNDDVAVLLTNNADNLQGSAGNDTFFAANGNLGAGDKITDASTSDNDTLSLAVDASTTNRNYGGFALTNIENVEVTNDSGAPVTLDLSSSTGIRTVASVNSSDSVIFDQLTSNATVIVDNVTGAGADVEARYQAAVTAGAGTTVNVVVNDATADEIILGTVGAGNTGIEIVNLTVTGTSTINALNTALTSLTINGGGDVTLANPLSNTVRTVNASAAGRVTVDFSNNDAAGSGVTFTGSDGADVVRAGQANDTINTGAGADVVVSEGGNDVINTEAGNDSVTFVTGAVGNVNVNTGADNDTVTFTNGGFDGQDTVNLGEGGADTLVLGQATVESSYAGVTSAETLTITTQTTTNLGNDGNGTIAETTAGIRTVNLNLAGNGGSKDLLDARDYVAAGLTVNLGGVAGTDTVLLGSGNDTVNTSSFDDTDNIQGNAGIDAIVVQDGATKVGLASQFGGIETITYVSDGDGDDNSLTVDDSNAPTAGQVLTVNAGGSIDTEVFTFNGTSVTTYSVNVTTGAANDSVNTSNGKADVVSTGAGNDSIFAAGGDTVTAGAGIDTISLGAGNNVVFAGADNDTINFGGPGDNKIYGEGGDDTFFVNNTGDLTPADVLDGGEGTDTIDIIGTVVDAQFTNATSVEVLLGGVGGTINATIGAEAQEAGIRTVNLTDPGADTLVATAYTADLTVNSSGGNDTIRTGSGNDLITVGVGTYTIDTGAGVDRVRVSGAELDASDKIIGGFANDDTIELDNSTGAVTGVVDLTNVSVANYRIIDDGDRLVGSDKDANTLTFTSTDPDVVTSVTPVNINASLLTDAEDTFTVVIANGVQDSDFTFNITGSSTATIVDKQNLGINNNINFTGGSGVDSLRINGGDAGSTVIFDGNDGLDRIVQTGGLLTDDGFIGVSEVEILTGDAGTINAVLGSQAARAGIRTIDGTNGQDRVTIGAGYTGSLTVNLLGGDDIINGGASTVAIAFNAMAGNLTAADILTGGSTTADSINITASGVANLNGVTKVETINVNNVNVAGETTVIDLDWLATETDGTLITVNVNGSGSDDTVIFNGGALTENVLFNGGAGADTITTGSGADTINANGGNDTVAAGAGADGVDGGEGNDTIRGELGGDLINGNTGDDLLYGDFAVGDAGYAAYFAANTGAGAVEGAVDDTIVGGIGNDIIVGGLGGDTLSGGDGVDTFRYQNVNDSRIFPGAVDNRDTITDFTSGTDKIDLLGLSALPVRFNGNWNTFGEGQGAVSGTGGDLFLDVVYVRESNTLWVDVDNNGQLNGDDLQVILSGVANVAGGDLLGGAAPAAPVETGTTDLGVTEAMSVRDYGMLREFNSAHFA